MFAMQNAYCINSFNLSTDYLVEFSGAARLTAGVNGTAGIFSTYPPDFVSNWTGFGDQVINQRDSVIAKILLSFQ